ncbi:NAD(P)-dependent alcohol dehydrogenase, partial [Rhizobium johnstonii]
MFAYLPTDLSTVRERFDVVYDTAATMTAAVGLGLLRQNGRFVALNPTQGKFIRSMFNRRMK